MGAAFMKIFDWAALGALASAAQLASSAAAFARVCSNAIECPAVGAPAPLLGVGPLAFCAVASSASLRRLAQDASLLALPKRVDRSPAGEIWRGFLIEDWIASILGTVLRIGDDLEALAASALLDDDFAKHGLQYALRERRFIAARPTG
jgi:hypothetical protein